MTKSIKRTIFSVLTMICAFSVVAFAACSESGQTDNGQSTEQNNNQSNTPSGSTEDETPDDTGSADNTGNDTSGTGESKILIAYFSATGSTERVAGYIAEATDGTLFELVPVDGYSTADLNYNNTSSRVYQEYLDESLRDIELASTTVDDWESYDVVFIGYPIWWGIAAWPVNNFVKNNDFTGKTVIPFCTSASSGLGQSGTLLEDMAGTGTWLEGQRFLSSVSQSTVTEWVENLIIT